MTHGKSEKARIIVAFGDIGGFTDFADSITDYETEFDPYFAVFDDIIDTAEKKTGWEFKDTGDGFMLIVDLVPNHACTVAIDVLNVLWDMYQAIVKLNERSNPRPLCFRMTVGYGFVRRKIRRSGKITLRGARINQMHNLLGIARGRGIVVHETFKNLLSEKQIRENGYQFTHIKNPGRLPDSLSRSDVHKLYEFVRLTEGQRRKQTGGRR